MNMLCIMTMQVLRIVNIVLIVVQKWILRECILEIKEAFETLRDFCKSNVDCLKCKFGIFNVKDFWECSLKVNYPCNWGEWENE